jgi:hypothetical protein
MTATKHFSSDAEIDFIGHGLLDRSLPKAHWTHAGHLAAAVWVIATRKELDPARDMPDIIRAYNLASGVQNTDTGGYHDTITQASVRAVRAFLAQQPAGTPLYAICNALLATPFGDKGWLLRYWSPDLLFSVAARRGWVAPDLLQLPFD